MSWLRTSAIACAILALGAPLTEAAAQEPAVPPAWAFLGKPFPEPPPAAPGGPAVPQRRMACGYCHLSTGTGRPENAAVAGLPRDYILRQVTEIRDGARVFPDGPLRTMLRAAKAATPEEIEAAAAEFSGGSFVSHVTVVEAADIPKATASGAIWRFSSDGAREPLGQRIVEGPEDFEAFEARKPDARFVAYVPPGALKRGEALAKGGPGRAACVSCHGEGLRGGPIGPPLAGRFPTSAFRQLWSFKVGLRHGSAAGLMRPVVEGLSEEDMIALAAYAGALKP